jgi:hypothetical protein
MSNQLDEMWEEPVPWGEGLPPEPEKEKEKAGTLNPHKNCWEGSWSIGNTRVCHTCNKEIKDTEM